MFTALFTKLLAKLNPVLIYIKIAGFLAALAFTGWCVYTVMSATAERNQRKAVSAAVEHIEAELQGERKLRAHYQTLADTKLDALLQSISNIKVVNKTITNNVTKERETFREFYMQPLPPGGYEQWKAARKLVSPQSGASAASSSSP